MSTLSVSDLKDLIKPLCKYYGKETTEKAINYLQFWYKEEAFNDDDFVNDWIPTDYKNCDGIDIFVNKLNYTKLENKDNKILLFEWICQLLLKDVPQPFKKPPHPTTQPDPTPSIFQEISNEFTNKLVSSTIPPFEQNYPTSQDIAKTFVDICDKDEYDDIENVQTDFEDKDNSSIFEAILDPFPQYKQYENDIFKILQCIIFDGAGDQDEDDKDDEEEKEFKCRPFELKHFVFRASDQTFKETVKLCLKECKNIFSKDEERDNSKTPKDALNVTQNTSNKNQENKQKGIQDEGDKDLLNIKALDLENKFPFLMCMMDLFGRCLAVKDREYWKLNKPPWQSVPNYIKLKPKQWFEENQHPFCEWIQTHCTSKCIKSMKAALASMAKRALPTFNYNYVLGFTLFDSLDIYAKYSIAMNKFIYNLIERDEEHLPLQIDFWIIPRLVKAEEHQDKKLNMVALYDVTFDEIDDDEVDKNNINIDKGPIKELGKHNDAKSKIWNVEEGLIKAQYKKGVDYFTSMPETDNFQNIEKLKKNIQELWNKNIKWDRKRYKRYIIIIDRRNPEHIEKTKMLDDTDIIKDQKWNDRMFLIIPKPKKGDKISIECEPKLNECFLSNTKEFLFPMSELQNYEYSNDFDGFDSGKGYKFLLSYHLYNKDKVKIYWYLNQGVTRFFMDDIQYLWPRFFKENDGKFQTLDQNVRNELEIALKQFTLKDDQFDKFMEIVSKI